MIISGTVASINSKNRLLPVLLITTRVSCSLTRSVGSFQRTGSLAPRKGWLPKLA